MDRQNNLTYWLDYQLKNSRIHSKQLASMIGINASTLSRVKHGRSPMGAQIKKRLSIALNTKLGDVPAFKHKFDNRDLRLRVLQHTMPAHAVTNFALKEGLFQKYGILAEEVPDREISTHFLTNYLTAIKTQLKAGHTVLAVGTEGDFTALGTPPIASLFSHIYKGYHIISRDMTTLPPIGGSSEYQRCFMLKVFLEHFENADAWNNHFDRFSWQTPDDLEFLLLLKRFSAVLTGTNHEMKYPVSHIKPFHKTGLESLHAFGSLGADFVLSDAGTLAAAYTFPDFYKVLLSLDMLSRTIQALSENTPTSVLSILKHRYPGQETNKLIKKFKSHWLSQLKKLERPVYWHVFTPKQELTQKKELLLDGLVNVMRDVRNTLSCPESRPSALIEIKNYCDSRTFNSQGKASPENFKLAWENCYDGI